MFVRIRSRSVRDVFRGFRCVWREVSQVALLLAYFLKRQHRQHAEEHDVRGQRAPLSPAQLLTFLAMGLLFDCPLFFLATCYPDVVRTGPEPNILLVGFEYYGV